MTRHLQINVRSKAESLPIKGRLSTQGHKKVNRKRDLKSCFLEAVSYIEHKFTVLSMTAFLAGIA